MKNTKKIKAIIIAIIGVLIALAIVIVFFVLKKNKPDAIEEDDKTSKVDISDLLNEGDKYLESLDYTQAVLSYKEALEKEPENVDAQLKLANAFFQSENYSDAEDMYKDIIDDNDNTEAYLGLAELYIRKNELKKAKELLEDAVAKNNDEKIKKMYEATNIKEPTFSVPGGTYTDRKKIEIKAGTDGDVIYYTTDGSTPTTKSKIYTDSIVLPNGNTTLKAYAINSLGYESKVVSATYVTSIVDANIDFTDKTIESAVKSALGKYGKLTNYDVDRIKILYILGDGSYVASASTASFDEKNTYIGSSGSSSYNKSTNIKTATVDLTDVTKLTNLEELYIADVNGLNLSLLAGMTNLKTLAVVNCGITDISSVASIKNLKKLSFNWNDVSDISGLSGLTELELLSMCGNKITNISAVSSMKNLKYLDISMNSVSDISALSGLTKLEQLWAYNNKIDKYSSLVDIRTLDILMIRDNVNSDKDSLTKIYPRLSRVDVSID